MSRNDHSGSSHRIWRPSGKALAIAAVLVVAVLFVTEFIAVGALTLGFFHDRLGLGSWLAPLATLVVGLAATWLLALVLTAITRLVSR